MRCILKHILLKLSSTVNLKEIPNIQYKTIFNLQCKIRHRTTIISKYICYIIQAKVTCWHLLSELYIHIHLSFLLKEKSLSSYAKYNALELKYKYSFITIFFIFKRVASLNHNDKNF